MNTITYTVPPCKGNRYAIGDVHGCFYTLLELIDSLSISTSDQVFFLGDMIGRGVLSKEVIDFIVKNNSIGYQLHPIRGNHEHCALAELYLNHKLNKELNFLEDEDSNQIKHYTQFLKELPFYLEVDNAFLVHAGFSFDERSFLDTRSMLHTREQNYNTTFFKNKYIIHGHTPVSLDIIRASVSNKTKNINIDNGCVYKAWDRGLGALVAINLDTLEMYVVQNIDE